ncbi:MAG: UTP--glucose-1-phosphate uridylyltransferase GalU [Pseudomonadota bacterium]
MSQPVKAAVFPVAGRGTRFLPATKASAKEMLPIVDKPLIQYAVEEAVAAGATNLVFVTHASKRAIEDHFDVDPELERALADGGKQELLDIVRSIKPDGVSCTFIRQGIPYGLGHAVLCAEPAVGNQPFFVHLPDDLIRSETPCLKQMADFHAQHGGAALAVQQVPKEKTGSYGIVALHDNDPLRRIASMVEKPKPENAPSTLAVVGRYLLDGSIFDVLKTIGRGAGGEIQLTDAIAAQLGDIPTYAYAFEGKRYDCGNKLGFLEAQVEYGLAHPEIGSGFRDYLKDLP